MNGKIKINMLYRGWWPSLARGATSAGDGLDRFTIPTGVLRPGRNWARATANDTAYLAKGWAPIDVPETTLRVTRARVSRNRKAVRVIAQASGAVEAWRVQANTVRGTPLAQVRPKRTGTRLVLTLRSARRSSPARACASPSVRRASRASAWGRAGRCAYRDVSRATMSAAGSSRASV